MWRLNNIRDCEFGPYLDVKLMEVSSRCWCLFRLFSVFSCEPSTWAHLSITLLTSDIPPKHFEQASPIYSRQIPLSTYSKSSTFSPSHILKPKRAILHSSLQSSSPPTMTRILTFLVAFFAAGSVIALPQGVSHTPDPEASHVFPEGPPGWRTRVRTTPQSPPPEDPFKPLPGGRPPPSTPPGRGGSPILPRY